MSILLSVAVTVSEDDSTYIQVARSETVIPASLGEDNEAAADTVDLMRATLDRLSSEAFTTADRQIGQLRSLLGGD